MTLFGTVFGTELAKLRRSVVPWAVAAIYCIAPVMVGLMMDVLLRPELGKRLGLLTAKAEMTIGEASWPTYLNLVSVLFAAGMIVFAIIQAYVFGREYAEGTAKNLLVLPIGRAAIVAAKFAVCALLFICMTMLVYVIAIAVGFLIGLPGYKAGMIPESLANAAKIVVQAMLAGAVTAWITVATRGYLAPVGVSIMFILIGDLFAHTGWGPWVPWSAVLMSAGAAGAGIPLPGFGSWVMLILFFFATAAGTYLSLERTDNVQ